MSNSKGKTGLGGEAVFRFLFTQHILLTIIDILLVLLVLNYLFKMMRGTKGILFLNAIIIIFLVYTSSKYFHLTMFSWMLEQLMLILVVALPIIFQNELKRVLETLGSRNPIIKWFIKPPGIAVESIDIVADAVENLSAEKIGALIVFEREDSLVVVSESGSYIDTALTKIMIRQIFYPNSPLHDGAVLIKGSRIQSAGCFLPLDNQLPLPQELGSRHRAGLSLSAQTDALVVIVSEETGSISLACSGILEPGYSSERLKFRLRELIQPIQPKPAADKKVSVKKTEV
jgi:diadenylate cyclase